jgi:hypothetical protein
VKLDPLAGSDTVISNIGSVDVPSAISLVPIPAAFALFTGGLAAFAVLAWPRDRRRLSRRS